MKDIILKNKITDIREKLGASFEAIPSSKDEQYKYFPIQEMMEENFDVEDIKENIFDESEDRDCFTISKISFNKLSDDDKKNIKESKNIFLLFSAITAQNFIVVDIIKSPKNPIKLKYLFQDEKQGKMSFIIFNIYQNVNVILKEDIKDDNKENKNFSFINYIFNLSENSNLKILKTNFLNSKSNVFINSIKNIEKSCNIDEVTVSLLNEGILRDDAKVNLIGEDAKFNVSNVILGNKKSFADTIIFANHKSPKTQSYQNIKSILNDEAKSSFLGEIEVKKDAQQVVSNQISKNILLNQKTKAYARPWLKIFADDVKCSHGATFGALDENSLFYLQTRGVNLEDAKKILLRAQIYEILNLADDEEYKLSVEKMLEL